MVSARAHEPESASSSPELHPISALDLGFERRLDRWLSSFRVGVGFAGLMLTVSLVNDLRWALALGAGYVAASASVFPLMRRAGDDSGAKHRVRLAILAADLLTVSAFVYGWGSRASPAMFMYVPIVVGWTLIPRRNFGRLALLMVLTSLALVLAFEDPSLALTPGPLRGGRLWFFGIAASVLVAIHQLLTHAVSQLVDHNRLVGVLLTEKRNLEREAAWVAQLEEAQRLEALGRLAGGVAHDFNNLLTALIGCAELAELCLRSDPDAAQAALNDLQRAAERGSGLTAQLLDAACRRPAQPVALDVGKAVRETAQLLGHLLRDDIALKLAPSDVPLGIRIDPSGLERALLNLAVNAADAMPAGGELRIATSLSEDAQRVELVVTDTGTGISPDDLPHIFEPFFTGKARGKGTGLGLASVYGIVKQSHGEVAVASSLGAGTSFRLSWPRVQLGPPAPTRAPPPTPGAGSVLLVDDDDDVRKVCEAHLRAGGYRVTAVRSAEEALAQLAIMPPDALVTDVSMPGMPGVELVRRMRALGHVFPALVVSGYAEELTYERALSDQPGVAFLAKPFTRERFLRVLGALLARARDVGP